jgi:hypothetical protein
MNLQRTLMERICAMHRLDEEYWSKRENWRWWCYTCPDDPRTIVSKRPRWAGYTINVAHRKSWVVLAMLIGLIMLPALCVIAIDPTQIFMMHGVMGIPIAVTIVVCYWLANPKERKGGPPNR